MHKLLFAVLTVIIMISSSFANAAPLKTYVADFNVVGATNKEELKTTLQGLLTSRLNPKQVKLVGKPEISDIQMFGSYAMFGKIFSIDLLIKNTQSGSMSKVFEQGESQDDLIPAFGRLAQKINTELAEFQPTAAVPVAPLASPTPSPVAVKTVAVPLTVNTEAAAGTSSETGYVVKSDAPRRNTPGNWTSEPVNGIFNSIALGRTMPNGDREIFISSDNSIRYFLKGNELKQIAEISIPVPAKVVAIDSADLDGDGIPEIYVSIVDRKTVSSRVFRPTEKGLELVAENLPWLFRATGFNLKEKSVFAQGMDGNGEYISGIAELKKTGNAFSTAKNLNIPKRGNVYNFTRFNDNSGAVKLAILDEDGYLAIYSADGNELGKSSDKFGGSETYINFESIAQLRNKIDKYRRNFLEQRISALSDGTLVIPRNIDSTLSIGNNRAYNKHSIFGLVWSGSVLSEAWHTRLTPSYLADYAYDTSANEFILLEVVQRAGLFTSGKTVISINKMK